MKKFVTSKQISFGICNFLVSTIVVILSVMKLLDGFGIAFGLSFLLDGTISLILIILQFKGKLEEKYNSYYIILGFTLCQVFEIEMRGSHEKIEAELILYIALKFMSILHILENKLIALIAYPMFYVYILIRLQIYNSPFPYLGLVYVHVFFNVINPKNAQITENNNCQNLIELIGQSIQTPFLVIDPKFKRSIFYNLILQEQFGLNKKNEDEFIETVLQFQSQNKRVKIQQFINESLQSVRRTNQAFQFLIQDCFENCHYVEQRPSKSDEYNYDEINEQKIFNIIDTPKYHQLKPSIQQLSDESPKVQQQQYQQQQQQQQEQDYQKKKKFMFSCFRDNLMDQQNKKLLKSKRFDITVTLCQWYGELVFVIELKDLELQSQIESLNEQIDLLTNTNQNKDLILATVFHDFKTPINGIMCLLESIEQKKELQPQTKFHLKIIRKNVYLMLYMIHDILDYARIQKNQLRLCMSDFFINEIVEEVIELIAFQAEQKGVVIHTYYNIPTYQMFSDPNRIKQVLMNILSNSLKFTESGTITISIDSINSDKSLNIYHQASSKNLKQQTQTQIQKQSIGQIRRQLSGRSVKSSIQKNSIYKITISDTGCGISEEVKPKLFNMFATFSTKDIQNKHGTGLGLLICKNLVKLLGPSEKIDLISEEHKGTSMSFQLYSRMAEQKNSPNYISVFNQEESSQNFNQNDTHNAQIDPQRFVRLSQLRVFQKVTNSNEILELEIQSEDPDSSKNKNMIDLNLKRLNVQFNMKNQIKKLQNSDQKEDSQEIYEPKLRIQRILNNKRFAVLIVDDQPFNVLAFKLLLQDAVPQLEIFEAFNGQQAINKILLLQKKHLIKYVFLDLNMPILNGWQTAIKLKELMSDKSIDPLKIVALSGFDDEQEQERCEKLGFEAFITKPIKLEIIAEVFVQLEKD